MLFEINGNNSADNIVIVRKNNKVGLSKNENDTVIVICQCEYDSIDIINHNFFLYKDDTIFCYNSLTDNKANYNEVVVDVPYIYSCDEEYQYIIHMTTDTIIHRKKLNKYNKSEYVCLGNTTKGHVFYDSKHSEYLYPTEDGYKFYNLPVNYPVIVNGDNTVNIIENENGIGIIDSFGNIIINSEYDKILLELKVTATNKDRTIKQTVPYKTVYRRSWLG